MHVDFGRLYEELAHLDWFSRCADLNFLIPDKERYWAVGGNDCWRLRFL